MPAITEKRLSYLHGKFDAAQLTRDEVLELFGHIEELEELLDEGDQDDAFGTEGWRHRVDID